MVTLEGQSDGGDDRSEEEIAAQNQVPISADPRMFDTHFIQLTKRQQKGQAKYRCRTCLHEFTCCGKRRRLQHILGDDFLIGKSKNVLNCKAPYQPLKDALLQLHLQQQQETLKRTREPLYTYEQRPGEDFHDGSVDHENDQEFRELLTDISFSTDFDGPEHNFTVMPGGVSSSAGSTSGDEGLEPISKRFRGEYMSNAGSTDSMDVASTTSVRSLYPDYVDEHNKRVQLNRAIINFFFLYRIPLTAVETDDFRGMMDAVLHYQQDSHQE